MTSQYKKGMEVMEKHLGPKAKDYVKNIEEIAPLFAKVNVESAFGEIYGDANSVLSSKVKELCTVAALVVQGFSLPQLKLHVDAALRVGATKEEIVEVITQMINYCGFPAATNALMTAKDVFKEHHLL